MLLTITTIIIILNFIFPDEKSLPLSIVLFFPFACFFYFIINIKKIIKEAIDNIKKDFNEMKEILKNKNDSDPDTNK